MTMCPGTKLSERDLANDPRTAIERIYRDLRVDCCDLEEMLEIAEDGTSTLSAQDLKRLDKAVTVMKVGVKIAKKALKRRALADVQLAPASAA